MTQYPVICISGGGEAPYGDALLAAVGVGAVDSYEVIKDWISFEKPVKPNPVNSRIYEAYFQQYISVYEALKDCMDELARLP